MRAVGLLRGVNIGAHNRIRMPDLRAIVESLGHTDVETYLQSGNVVFTVAGRGTAALGAELAAAISEAAGLDVGVTTRTGRQMAEVIDTNPFPDVDDPTHLVVVLCAEKVEAAALRQVDPAEYAPDEFRVRGREIYLHLPNGQARTKLGEAFWKRRLGGQLTTARNWRTVLALAEMSAA